MDIDKLFEMLRRPLPHTSAHYRQRRGYANDFAQCIAPALPLSRGGSKKSLPLDRGGLGGKPTSNEV